MPLTINGRELDEMDKSVLLAAMVHLHTVNQAGHQISFDGDDISTGNVTTSIENISAAVFETEEIVIEEVE